ncbi:MAG: ABC transporter permease [Ruthenibacterium sp.]
MKKSEKEISIKKSSVWEILVRKRETSVIAATLILFFIFTTTEGFLSSYNIFNVSRTAALFIFIAIAQSMVIMIGGMNVSLGAIGGLTAICFGYMVQELGFNTMVALIISLLLGMILGAVNGFIITKFKINAFVTTLATSFVFTGLVYGISKGNAYNKIPESYTLLGRKGIMGLPYLFWLAVAMLILMAYIFRFTVFGRRLFATGGNADAARMSGINTQRMVVIANTLSGLMAAIAGALTVSWLGMASPGTGVDWMMNSFAVAVIGGTALSGGSFSAIGMLFSGFLIALVKNGLVMLGVNVYLEQTFLGLIILGAVMLESIREKYLRNQK